VTIPKNRGDNPAPNDPRAGRFYQAFLPVFISGWGAKASKADIAFGLPRAHGLETPQNEIERRYALREVKQRLHQASFPEAVMRVYGNGVGVVYVKFVGCRAYCGRL
jgi:hypothetical protein